MMRWGTKLLKMATEPPPSAHHQPQQKPVSGARAAVPPLSLPLAPSVKQASGSKYSSGCSTGASSTSGLISMVLPSEELVSSSF